jgi:oligopeptide/dipeptide ABC transporter ATP-binding protein
MSQLLASIRDLSVRYRTRDDVSYAVDQVSLDIERGSVYALVGESGSGKTTVGMSVINLLPDEADILGGEVWFGDKNVLALNDRQLREIRGQRVTMIFQDPVAGLNPVIEIGDQVAEVLTTHLDMDKREGKIAALEVLAQVGLPDPKRVAKSYPFQLSGGMCQRVMIGIATALRPELIIADEPTASLDVTVQAQILHQLDTLRREQGTAILLITHDFGVVSQIADEVGVMYAGHLVETGSVRDVLASPVHPYTHGLLSALPRLDAARQELYALPGNPPDLNEPSRHCAFVPRCRKATQQCRDVGPPQLTSIPGKDGRAVACYNPVWQG